MQVFAPHLSTFQDAITISVSGAPRGGDVRVSMSVEDALGVTWRSQGVFKADASGRVNTTLSESLAGTYLGVDPGGLFWSMLPDVMLENETRAEYCQRVIDDRELPLMPTFGELEPVRYDVLATEKETGLASSTVLEKARLSAGVRVISVNEGRLRGVAFIPSAAKAVNTEHRGVLILGGSEGGLLTARAAAMAKEGFLTLVLGYFAYEDRPKEAIDLPLEYFSEGLKWLRQRCDSTAIWGSSRGSEAAMLTACYFSDLVDAVIAWVPSHVVNTGFDMESGNDFSDEHRAMWSYAGISVQGMRHPQVTSRVKAERKQGFSAFPGYAFYSEFKEMWGDEDSESPYSMPLRRLKAPVFIVAGGDDQLWPSAYAARKIEEALASNGFDKSVEVHCYSSAGHMIGVPNEVRPFSDVVCWRDGYSGVDAGLVHYGGSPPGNAYAARDSWAKVTEFLDRVLV